VVSLMNWGHRYVTAALGSTEAMPHD